MSRDRSSLLADSSFRAHLILVVTGTTAALLVMGSAVILTPLFLRFEGAESSPHELGRLADRILALHGTLWPLIAICIGSVLASSWLLYRRMVSPMVRFTQVFRSIESGSLPGPIQLRATDYLGAETAALNEMTLALKERHGAVSAAGDRLRAELEDLADWAAHHGGAEGARLVATLQDREKALSDQIRRVTSA